VDAQQFSRFIRRQQRLESKCFVSSGLKVSKNAAIPVVNFHQFNGRVDTTNQFGCVNALQQ
jgi:hypothetical protein